MDTRTILTFLTLTALLILGLIGLWLYRQRQGDWRITSVSWTSREGLRFVLDREPAQLKAILLVKQRPLTPWLHRYQVTGQADFEQEGTVFTLTPYSFKPASPWRWPLSIVSAGSRSNLLRLRAESQTLCQILAGQNRRQSRSALMGLMRRRPDHRLGIRLSGSGRTLHYDLSVAFWTSEISR